MRGVLEGCTDNAAEMAGGIHPLTHQEQVNESSVRVDQFGVSVAHTEHLLHLYSHEMNRSQKTSLCVPPISFLVPHPTSSYHKPFNSEVTTPITSGIHPTPTPIDQTLTAPYNTLYLMVCTF